MISAHPATGFVVALLVTAALMPVVIRFTRHAQLIDIPGSRSLHDRPIPRGGGVGPALGCFAAYVLVAGGRLTVALALALALAFGAVGLIDDVRSFPALRRLVIQFMLAGSGVIMLNAGLGDQSLSGLAGAIAVVWIVAYTNAFNFMDGINGISAGQAAICGATYGITALVNGETALALGSFALAGAAVGFAPFNVSRPQIFLGDVGSYFLGGWIALLALLLLTSGASPVVVIAPVVLYLADTATTLLNRARRDLSLFEAHKEHAYQRLVEIGWSHSRVAGSITATSAIMAASAHAVRDAPPWAQGLVTLWLALLTIGYLAAPRSAGRYELPPGQPRR